MTQWQLKYLYKNSINWADISPIKIAVKAFRYFLACDRKILHYLIKIKTNLFFSHKATHKKIPEQK